MIRFFSVVCTLAVWALSIADKSVTQISPNNVKSKSGLISANCGVGGSCGKPVAANCGVGGACGKPNTNKNS